MVQFFLLIWNIRHPIVIRNHLLQQRQETAAEEFKKHGLEDRVTTYWRDVIELGWPVTGEADAVFLDLPRPWVALHHSINAIKSSGGRICSFSPCIEQVIVSAMRNIFMVLLHAYMYTNHKLNFSDGSCSIFDVITHIDRNFIDSWCCAGVS